MDAMAFLPPKTIVVASKTIRNKNGGKRNRGFQRDGFVDSVGLGWVKIGVYDYYTPEN